MEASDPDGGSDTHTEADEFEVTSSGSPYIFEDGYESGDFSAWTATTTSTGETTSTTASLSHHGTYSGLYTSNGGGGYEWGYSSVAVSESELYARGYFRVSQSGISDNGDRFYFLRFRNGGNILASAGWRMTGGDVKWALSTRDGSGWVTRYSAAAPVLGGWYCVELHWVEDAAVGFAELYVDGVLVCSASGLDTADFGGVGEVCVGLAELVGCGSSSVYGDCVVVSDFSIGTE